MPLAVESIELDQRAAKKAKVLTTLKVIGVTISVEPIRLPEGRVAPGHARVTLHVLTKNNEPTSLDIPLETYHRFFQALLFPDYEATCPTCLR